MHLLGIIQIMNYRQKGLTTYSDQLLYPWCIVRVLPNQQSELIVRFRNAIDAEAHLQILRVKNPAASYQVVFDMTPKHSSSAVIASTVNV